MQNRPSPIRTIRASLGVAMAAAAAGMAAALGNLMDPEVHRHYGYPRRLGGPSPRSPWRIPGVNWGHNTKPHQGARECARRVGGKTWADFRASERVRRGLPAGG